MMTKTVTKRLLSTTLSLLLGIAATTYDAGAQQSAQQATTGYSGQGAPLTAEELYRKCRRSTFRRHGQRVIRDGRRKLAIASVAATQMVDQCVLRNRWRTVRAP
jgi:hypothetical protein